MSKSFRFYLPGITCINCVAPIEKALNKCQSLKIESYSTDIVTKTILITLSEGENLEGASLALKKIIEEIGVDCIEIVDTGTNFLGVPESEATNHQQSIFISKNKKRIIRSHLIKGLIGTFFGAALIALTLTGLTLPMAALYAIISGSSLLTLFLGKESYWDAFVKLIKAQTFTMDALFTVSTLTVIGVSIASLFVPWLPMMLEAGVLIFGFRHLGKVIEESINQKVDSGLSFKDRAAATVFKKIERRNEVDTWIECAASELQANNIIRVKNSEIIPTDGECLSENVSIYKTILTGAILPSAITQGEPMYAGMKVPDYLSFIEMRVSKPASGSHLAFLDQEIAKANTEKSPIETTANNILHYFVPGILAFSALAGILIGFLVNPILALQCAISMLVSACPCTLGFIIPMSVKIGMSKALENGVRFKSGKRLQDAERIDTIVFDLNGTLTKGAPSVIDYHIFPGEIKSDNEFFSCLAAMEEMPEPATGNQKKQHPIGKAIYHYAKEKLPGKKHAYKMNQIDQTSHSGVRAMRNGTCYLAGNIEFLKKNGIHFSDHDLKIKIKNAEQIIYLAKNEKIVGYLKVKDPIREDAKLAIQELKQMGKEVHLCTGTDEKTALGYAKELNIPLKNVYANCIGASSNQSDRTKPHYISQLQANKKRVAMIGDAANDALAIAKSDFGIAVQSGAADVITQIEAGAVIYNASLLPVVTAFAVAKQTAQSIKQNLIASLTYNSGVLIAGGVLAAIGFACNPAIGVALMVLQTTLILLNQYRIKKKKFSYLSSFTQEVQVNPEKTSTYQSFQKNNLLTLQKDKIETKPPSAKKRQMGSKSLFQSKLPAITKLSSQYTMKRRFSC